MREAMEAMGTTLKDYHWSRASGLEKIAGDTKAENSSSKTDEDDGERARHSPPPTLTLALALTLTLTLTLA